MRRIALSLLALVFAMALVGCHQEKESDLQSLDDVRKASEGKENLDPGPAPTGTFSR